VVGIDLGGTKILAGVVSANHQILGRAKRNTPAKEGGPAILAAIIECVDEALEGARLRRDQIAALGVGSPGPLDIDAGVILFSANLNVKNYAIGPELFASPVTPSIVSGLVADTRVSSLPSSELASAAA
jgi:glucokinase